MARASKVRLILVVAGVIALIVFGRTISFDVWFARFGAWIAGLGAAGYLLYAAAHVGVTLLMLPAVLMTIGAGFLFGLWTGTAVALAGATVGATLAFLVARYLARDRVARAAARDPRFTALDRAIGEKGWRIVFLLRMSAVVPFVLSNYVYGLTAIRFWPYVAASAIGLIPLTVLWVALGAAARRLDPMDVDVASAPPMPEGLGIAVISAGVLITAGVTVYVARLTKGILQRPPTE
jgi:uncharacterized membrane protein YdjX (TVP38/TMEM64 family)